MQEKNGYRLFGLPWLDDPEPESVFDTRRRVPEHLDALYTAAAPIADGGWDGFEQTMRIREVVMFIEELRDHYHDVH